MCYLHGSCKAADNVPSLRPYSVLLLARAGDNSQELGQCPGGDNRVRHFHLLCLLSRVVIEIVNTLVLAQKCVQTLVVSGLSVSVKAPLLPGL